MGRHENSMKEKSIHSHRGSVVYWLSKCQDETAKTIAFLHGLTGDHTLFEKQADYFAREYHVLCWDAPAHGSSRPYDDFSYANAAEELKAILDAEQISQVILVGQSMGGYVAQAFLKQYPELVMGFVGIDTSPFGVAYYSRSDQWWLRQVEWMSLCFPHKMLVKAIASSCTYTQYAYEAMRTMLSLYTKRELCHLMGIAYAAFLKENCDLDIQCPVLLLLGEYDKTGKVRQYCEAWRDRTGYPLHIIRNAAHNSNMDNWEEVNAEIERFINSL